MNILDSCVNLFSESEPIIVFVKNEWSSVRHTLISAFHFRQQIEQMTLKDVYCVTM